MKRFLLGFGICAAVAFFFIPTNRNIVRAYSPDELPNQCRLVEGSSSTRHFACPRGTFVTSVRALGHGENISPIILVRCTRVSVICEQ